MLLTKRTHRPTHAHTHRTGFLAWQPPRANNSLHTTCLMLGVGTKPHVTTITAVMIMTMICPALYAVLRALLCMCDEGAASRTMLLHPSITFFFSYARFLPSTLIFCFCFLFCSFFLFSRKQLFSFFSLLNSLSTLLASFLSRKIYCLFIFCSSHSILFFCNTTRNKLSVQPTKFDNIQQTTFR